VTAVRTAALAAAGGKGYDYKSRSEYDTPLRNLFVIPFRISITVHAFNSECLPIQLIVVNY